jgi:hypothetical protein
MASREEKGFLDLADGIRRRSLTAAGFACLNHFTF